MSDPNSAATPNPGNSNSQAASPTPSAADLAKAVLGASETLARASAGDLPGAVRTGIETATTAAASKQEKPEEPSSVVPAPHIPLPTSEPTAAVIAQVADAVSNPVPGRDDQRDLPPESPAAETTHPEATPADEDKKEKKKPGLGPRWSYIITRGLVVALVWAFFAYIFDPLIRFGAVQSTQHVVGARVDVEKFSTEFFPPRIRISSVAVANRNEPMSNLLEFESLTGEVDGLALMKKSYILNKAVVTGLRWGTERTESGQLDDEDPIDETTEDKGKSELLSKLEEAGKQWANELLGRATLKYDPKNLETYVLADQLEDEWKTDFDDLELRVDNVETQAKKLKELFDVAKRDPLRNLAKIDQIVKEGLRLKGHLREIRTDVGRLPPKAQQDLNELNSSRQRDQERIQREIKDLVLNEDNLSEFLLGPELHNRITQSLSWLQWTDERVDRFGSVKPKRTRGEVIAFTDRNPLPSFLARLIDVSGEGEIAGDQLSILGTISDVTNDPVLHGKPTVVRLEGHGDAIVKLHATIDRTQELPSNELNLSYSIPRPTDEMLGDGDSLAVLVHAESTKWTANLRTVDDQLSGTIVLRQKPVQLVATLKEGTDPRLRQIVETSVAAVNEVQATVTLSGTVREPKWKLRTTLGRKILRGVERGVNDALSAQKEALVAKLDGEMKGRQEQFLGKLNGRYGDITKQLQLNDKVLNDLNANELIQRVSGGKFDPRKIFKR